MRTSVESSVRRLLASLPLQAMLLFVTTVHALPLMNDRGPARAKVLVEDFSGFEPSNYSDHLVTVNGIIDLISTIYVGDVCGEGNKCLGPEYPDWDVLFRELPERTLLWSTDFLQPLGSSFTTWTVTGGSGVSVFSNLAYRPSFAFFDPLGLISIQLHVAKGVDEYGEPIIEYYRFDNITTISIEESGGAAVLCAALFMLFLSRRWLKASLRRAGPGPATS
jgi:hypothetical protein